MMNIPHLCLRSKRVAQRTSNQPECLSLCPWLSWVNPQIPEQDWAMLFCNCFSLEWKGGGGCVITYFPILEIYCLLKASVLENYSSLYFSFRVNILYKEKCGGDFCLCSLSLYSPRKVVPCTCKKCVCSNTHTHSLTAYLPFLICGLWSISADADTWTKFTVAIRHLERLSG